jgi:hypothetical protein
MESDWEIEIGDGAPVIDAVWEGYIDLRGDTNRVAEIAETAQFPALSDALIRLNSSSSPMWTAKCDVWPVEAFDADELDADRDAATSALGCYVDLLPCDAQMFSTLDAAADWCGRLCLHLRARRARQCRADAVLRRAFITPESVGLGVTTYLTACGSTRTEAATAISNALALLADSVLAVGPSGSEGSKYNESIVGE